MRSNKFVCGHKRECLYFIEVCRDLCFSAFRKPQKLFLTRRPHAAGRSSAQPIPRNAVLLLLTYLNWKRGSEMQEHRSGQLLHIITSTYSNVRTCDSRLNQSFGSVCRTGSYVILDISALQSGFRCCPTSLLTTYINVLSK